jgi:hypothetical protein
MKLLNESMAVLRPLVPKGNHFYSTEFCQAAQVRNEIGPTLVSVRLPFKVTSRGGGKSDLGQP